MAKHSFFKRSMTFLMMMAGCASPQKPVQTATAPEAEAGERWIAYYDNIASVDYFKSYDLVVFDGQHYPAAFNSLQPHTTVLGYLSIGEVHGHAPEAAELKSSGAVIGANGEWSSYIIDPRNKEWRSLILDKKIPALVAAGFDGIMLDTLDSPLSIDSSKQENAAIRAASVSLVRDIRTRYPNMKLMLNRGFELLDPLAGYIDYTLAESTFAKYMGPNKKPTIWDHSAQRPIVDILRRAREKNPQLRIYTLDYWDMNDVEGVQFIYQVQRMRGFIPYVASPDLRTTHAEPAARTSESLSLRG